MKAEKRLLNAGSRLVIVQTLHETLFPGEVEVCSFSEKKRRGGEDGEDEEKRKHVSAHARSTMQAALYSSSLRNRPLKIANHPMSATNSLSRRGFLWSRLLLICTPPTWKRTEVELPLSRKKNSICKSLEELLWNFWGNSQQ